MNKKLIREIKELKFKYFGLSLSNQVVIFLSFFGIFTLFMPWIIDSNNLLKWNSFNSIVGNIGYLMILIYIFQIFTVLSNSYKEKIKLYTDISFKNHFIIICTGIISVFFSVICISFIKGLTTLGQNIINGKGLIFFMVVGIFLILFGIIIRNDYKKNSSEIILEKLNQNREKVKDKDNMTLPI